MCVVGLGVRACVRVAGVGLTLSGRQLLWRHSATKVKQDPERAAAQWMAQLKPPTADDQDQVGSELTEKEEEFSDSSSSD